MKNEDAISARMNNIEKEVLNIETEVLRVLTGGHIVRMRTRQMLRDIFSAGWHYKDIPHVDEIVSNLPWGSKTRLRMRISYVYRLGREFGQLIVSRDKHERGRI